ncbi:MAG: hypothetical protein HYX41_03875 [Bdellovibrio sp.]|nr:hypothetical protein [Bdellovibrio sp.]
MFLSLALWILGGMSLAVASGPTGNTGDSSLSAFPARTCEELWSDRKVEDYQYNFLTDTVLTPKGNEGYTTFLNRLTSNKIERSDCNKKWTVLIYMAVEPKLVPYSIADMYEMESVYEKATKITGSTLKTDVIVQWDNPTTSDSRRMHLFQSHLSPRRNLGPDELAKLSLAEIHSPIISSDPIRGDSVKERFRDFLMWGTRAYPSEHYLVIVWGHGKGWTSKKEGRKAPGGIAIWPKGERLDIPSLREILNDVQNQIQDKIDVLVADACRMQTVETTSELDKNARFIIGSEDTQSYAGLPYGDLLAAMNRGHFKKARKMLEDGSNPHEGRRAYYNLDEAYLLSWTIPYLYKKSLLPGGTQAGTDPKAIAFLTGNSLETKQLRRTLLPSMDALGLALQKYITESDDHWMKIRLIVEKGKIYDEGTQDFGSFLKALHELAEKDPRALQLKEQVRLTYDALNYAVVNSALGTNYPEFDPYQQIGPRGLAVWLPKNDADYADRADDFAKSIFYEKYSNWYGFMQTLYLPVAKPKLASRRSRSPFRRDTVTFENEKETVSDQTLTLSETEPLTSTPVAL